MNDMNLSDLRHRLALERPDLTPDSGGGTSVTWIKIADVWASITPLRMIERFTGHQTGARLSHKIIIRYREDVLPEMRLTTIDRVFEIISVLNEKERNHWLHLECTEIII